MKKFLFALSLFAGIVNAQNYNAYLKDNTTYREHPLDITHMKVDVKFKADSGLVIGKVVHSFTVLQKQVDSVFFDAPGIKIYKATLNNQAVNYTTDAKGVWVKPADPLKWDATGTISFEYEATPRRGIYFIGWNVQPPAEPNPFAVRKQIWTQGQGIDNRYWIPMYDDMNDKFITETVITFDKEYQVLSNGSLLKKTSNKDNTITWNYTMTKPHAGYLLMLAIGKYGVYSTKSKGGVPLNNWYYPEFKERMEPSYRYTADMMDFLEKETGIKYPWESYSQVMVQDFIFGAMENTTATIFGDFFNVDERAFADRNYVGVNCHEMTHQWFGDYITARDGRDTWLQESYATYWPKQFSKQNEGMDEWNWQRRLHQNAAIEAGKKDNYPVHHTQGGSPRVYPKGAAVISMLEYVLGEEQWKRALTHYLKSHAYANVETNDLQQAIQDKLGKDLSWFFDQWIYRGGEPNYLVRYNDISTNDGNRATEVVIEQTQKTDETVRWFKMPVWFEVNYEDGTKDELQVVIEKQYEAVRIPNKGKKKIAFVLFDRGSNIIKQVSFAKPFEELKAQALKAANILDRYDAVLALKETPVSQKRNLLLDVLKNEKHHGIISEIVMQLMNDSNTLTETALQGIFMDPAVKASVHESIAKNRNNLNPTWISLFTKVLNDNHYSYDVQKATAEKLFAYYSDKGAKEKMEEVLNAIKQTQGMHNAIAIKYGELAIAYYQRYGDAGKADEAKNRIIQYASPQYEFRTRILAFGCLKSLNYCDERVVKQLFQSMLSPNGRLASPAAQLAEYFSNQQAYKQLMINYYRSQTWQSWQKELLKKQMAFLG